MDSVYKLPVKKIIISSLSTLWINKAYYSKALSIPTLLLVLIWAIWHFFSENMGVLLSLFFMIIYTLAYCLFAITCHRLVLIENKIDCFNFYTHINKRVISFFIWVVYIYICISIIDVLPMAIIYNIDQLLELNININQNEWVLFLICIPGLYLLGRVSLLFPAKAIDEKIDLKKSWEITKNNGWRIFVIIGFYPWILGMIIWLVWGREEASLFEDVISSLLTVLILALEVVALSFTYKELVSYKAKEL